MATEEPEASPPRFIRFGTVLAGAQPFSFNNNINSVFRGQVMLASGAIVTAFIKDLDAREFANELLAAALGLRLGLPIPTPIIASAGAGSVSASRIALPGTSDHLVFASHAIGATPVLQMLRDAGPHAAAIIDAIAKWDALDSLYGFDAWVANIDRHRGNLLLSGQGDVWMIDHGQCFTGPAWQASALAAGVSVRNRLAEWLTPSLTGKRRSEVQSGAETLAAEASQISISQLGDAEVLSGVLGADFNAIVAYLEARSALVPDFSKAALGLLV